MKEGDDSFIKQRIVFKQFLVDHKDRYPAAYKHITNLHNLGVWDKKKTKVFTLALVMHFI